MIVQAMNVKMIGLFLGFVIKKMVTKSTPKLRNKERNERTPCLPPTITINANKITANKTITFILEPSFD